MKLKLLLISTLLPTFVLADPIVSLEWSSHSEQLVVATPSEIRLLSNDGRIAHAGPNSQIQDATLFDNGSQLLIGTADGAFISSLGEIQWEAQNIDLDIADIEFVFTNVELQDVLYAAVQDSVYKYTKEENSWVNMDAGPGGEITDYLHTNMPDSMDTGWIFASTTSGIAFTADCFCFWRDVPNFSESVHAITYQPDEPSWLYAATEHTLYVSRDGARSWQPLIDAPASNASALATGNKDQLYLGTETGELYLLDMNVLTWSQIE